MNRLEKLIKEDLQYFSVDDASPESDEFEIGLEEDCEDEDTVEYIKKRLEEFNNQFL